MKYFIDTEFIEGFHKPLFGKRRHFIDLISIGVVCEDGRSYYAISTDFKAKDASDWVKKNVIAKLPDRYASFSDPGTSPRSRKEAMQWKPTKVIVTELLDFFGCWRDQHFWRAPKGIEVYGYYADYDWVLFCSLLGTMMDLPKQFPMYCRDLKQMFDEKFDLSMHEVIKGAMYYPKQQDEHNALADAEWNKRLYDFITEEKIYLTK